MPLKAGARGRLERVWHPGMDPFTEGFFAPGASCATLTNHTMQTTQMNMPLTLLDAGTLAPIEMGDAEASLKAEDRNARDLLLFRASGITELPDDQEAQYALKLASELKRWRNSVKDAKEALVKPLAETITRIENTAKEAVAKVNAEIIRLESLAGRYHAEKEVKEEALLAKECEDSDFIEYEEALAAQRVAHARAALNGIGGAQ